MRGNNVVAKALHHLRRRGIRSTVRKTLGHFDRKRAERRFVAGMVPGEEELKRQREKTWARKLTFSVIVPLYNTPADLLAEMVESVRQQTYGGWELCLADGSDEKHGYVETYCRRQAEEDSRIRYERLERNGGISENSNACVAMARGEYLALLDHDDLLLPHALYEMRTAIDKTGADFLYSDEMIFRSPNRKKVIGVRVKPSFSPDSLAVNNYICHLTVFSRELMEKVGGFRKEMDGSQDHDLFLRMTNRARGIAHVAQVLYLWRAAPSSVAADIHSKTYAIEAGRRAVADFLQQEKGITATVESTDVFPTMYRIRYPIMGQPRVRVILDARKGTGDGTDGVDARVRSLSENAGWPHVAWTVIGEAPAKETRKPDEIRRETALLDSAPKPDAARAELSEDLSADRPAPGPEDASKTAEGSQDSSQTAEGGPVITWLAPREGESRRSLWQRAAEACDEEYLLFVDGVPSAGTGNWLRGMLGYAALDHVGAVCPQILFEEGSIRHAGVVVGMGENHVAGRSYFLEEGDNPGYFGLAAVAGNVAAGCDCLMVSREKWLRAGGFDAAYQDALFEIDLCLRLLDAGYYNVYDPHARLRMGKEAEVRPEPGREYDSWPRDAETFRIRNARVLRGGDPCYSPNLSKDRADWLLVDRKPGDPE